MVHQKVELLKYHKGRDVRTNKRNALKRKKRLEKTLQQIDETLTTLEYHREAVEVN